MRRATGLLVLGVCVAFALRASASVEVVPGGSTVAGKTIGQWTEDWWNWAGKAPVIGAINGGNAEENQSGPVFFIAGTSGATVERTFNVPTDKYVLFPLINWLIANGPDPGFANTSEEAVALTSGTIDPTKLVAILDGVAVSDLASRREAAPSVFTFTTIAGATGFPAGTYTDAAADGYWIMLNPLSAGPHTLRFGGTTVDYVGPDPLVTVPSFTVDTLANINPGGPAAVPLPPAAYAALPVLLAFVLDQIRRHTRTV